MSFYNWPNMSNFTYQNFGLNFAGFGWPNFTTFFFKPFFMPLSNFNYPSVWRSGPAYNIGDIFINSTSEQSSNASSTNLNFVQSSPYGQALAKLEYTPSSYLVPEPDYRPVQEAKILFNGVDTTIKPAIIKKEESVDKQVVKKSDTIPMLVDYRSLTRAEALNAAKKDPNLERLMTTTSEKGYTVTVNEPINFINDIPYARKGAMDVILAAADKIECNLEITSALGSKLSPHAGTSTGNSHYNPLNPKIDFGGQLSHKAAENLKQELDSTGLFEFVKIEYDGDTAHLDTKIKLSAYKEYA